MKVLMGIALCCIGACVFVVITVDVIATYRAWRRERRAKRDRYDRWSLFWTRQRGRPPPPGVVCDACSKPAVTAVDDPCFGKVYLCESCGRKQ